MFLPSKNQFVEFSENAGLIPVFKEIVADLDTPLTLFAKIEEEFEHTFLFESMEGGEKWGRYSFIGFDPLVSFNSTGEDVTVITYNGTKQVEKLQGNPLHLLKELVEKYKAVEYEGLPRFCGGAVGYLGYDMVRFMEELPDTMEPLDIPESSFIVPRFVLVHDSFKQTVKVVCWSMTDSSDPEKSYQEALSGIEEVICRLKKGVPESFIDASNSGDNFEHTFSSNMEQETFYQIVEQAKEYIRSGDIIQVVLSQRFHTKTNLKATRLYRALRHINPSPYLFFLKLGGIIQIGSSPEILVRKDGNDIELRPIAGTRKRGLTIEEDLALEKELLADPKEKAEHMMLVDLGRNDVGRVSKGGYVEVRDLMVIERYSHVMHIVSGVHGIIRDDMDQFDVLSACFPAGTVSGAPKIRAMEIIEELEPQRRGPYAGAVGYFGFSGNMDFCITIRTFIMQGDDLWVQAGAGIVYDSVPEKEYEETVNKSMGLRKAVELAQKGF